MLKSVKALTNVTTHIVLMLTILQRAGLVINGNHENLYNSKG